MVRALGPSYHYVRRQLQLLSWKYGADHWVLKAPAHLSRLEELLEAFPDASVIVMHRDPLQVIPSTCSLMAGFRGIVTDRLDLRRLGAECAQELAWSSQRMIAARTALDPARFLDVSYERMVADPISTIREACRHFGYDFSPSTKRGPAATSPRTPATSTGFIATASRTSASTRRPSITNSPITGIGSQAGNWWRHAEVCRPRRKSVSVSRVF